MFRALCLIGCLLSGVALACGSDASDEDEARATIEAVVARVSATLTVEDRAPEPAPSDPRCQAADGAAGHHRAHRYHRTADANASIEAYGDHRVGQPRLPDFGQWRIP